MNANPNKIFKSHQVAQSFSQATKTYDQQAFVQNEVGQRLLERLCLLKHPPTTIVDIGAGTGKITDQLRQQFPDSDIFALDLAWSMCQHAQHQSARFGSLSTICANTEALPFKNGSIDFIFSNCCLQWCDLPQALREFKRVLSPQGVLFFSTFGPQTLIELRNAWQQVSTYQHVNAFIDMHDIGDLLLNLNFLTPVVDMETITATFKHPVDLLKYLKSIGAHNLNPGRNQGLSSPRQLNAMLKAYHEFKQADNLFPATFEIIYGHAFQNNQPAFYRDENGLAHIPANSIPVLD